MKEATEAGPLEGKWNGNAVYEALLRSIAVEPDGSYAYVTGHRDMSDRAKTKFSIWRINDRLFGRYWLIAGGGYGPDEEGHETQKHGLRVERAGEPTQRFYRIPSSWLKECNSLRLFEEGGSKSPMLARIESRRAR